MARWRFSGRVCNFSVTCMIIAKFSWVLPGAFWHGVATRRLLGDNLQQARALVRRMQPDAIVKGALHRLRDFACILQRPLVLLQRFVKSLAPRAFDPSVVHHVPRGSSCAQSEAFAGHLPAKSAGSGQLSEGGVQQLCVRGLPARTN